MHMTKVENCFGF